MENSKKTYLFEESPVPKAIFTLAIPTIISSLVMVIYNLADTYFVGMLNDPIQNAAVTLSAPVLLAFNAINNLFGVGASSMMSRALGRKDYETVAHSSAFGFYCSLACGILFSLCVFAFHEPLLALLGTAPDNLEATGNYLMWTAGFGAVPAILNVVMAYLFRSEGSSLHASIGTMSGCLLNIILDPFFILPFGLNMGAAGAGCATFLSNCVALVYFMVLRFVKRNSTYVCISPAKFRCGKSTVLGICAVGIPASVQNLLNVTGMTFLNNFTASYGSDAVAAMGIAQKINMIPLYVALGFSQGIMPLVSYNYSSGNSSRTKETILFAYKISIAFILVIAALIYLNAGALIGLFMKNEIIITYGAKFLHGLSLSLPFLCADFLAVGIFQACGMGGRSFVFAILRKIILEIPAMFILNMLFPLYGLAYAQFAAEFVLAIAAALMIRKIFRSLPEHSLS